mgnify:CR=1 FL=1
MRILFTIKLCKKFNCTKKKDPLYKSQDIKGLAAYINDNKPKNIILMTGAGISTACGIPDFRSPKTGLYANLQKYNLERPEDIFSIGFFKENPKPFCVLAKELFPGKFIPTHVHFFVKLLADKGLLLRNYTQNIDTLERVAKVPKELLVEAHGSFAGSHCTKCNKVYETQFVKTAIMNDQVPICTIKDCKGVIKPDIVFFGESLPDRFGKLAAKDFPKCDLLIVIGTSLKVQPFASLISRVNDECPRFLINMEKAGEVNKGEASSLFEMLGLGTRNGFDFDKNYRDACELGDCQTAIKALVKHLGWDNDLATLVKNGTKDASFLSSKKANISENEASSSSSSSSDSSSHSKSATSASSSDGKSNL